MKLLFVIKSLSLSGGGAERVLAEVTAGLAQCGHEVTVVSFDAPEACDFYAFGSSIRRVRMGIGSSEQRSGIGATWRRIRSLRKLVRHERPDVAVAFMHSAYIPLAFALGGTRIPAVGSEHIVYRHYRERPAERALLRIIPPLLYSITAISEEIRLGFPRAIRKKMRVIPNPVQVDPAALADVRGGPEKRILNVGRLEEQKDQATLIAAFSEAAARFPQWRLRIVGEGVLRPVLEAQIASLGLKDRVELPGSTAEIGAEYAAAQIFAISSTYESFGLATAEAMAHGLPVIGFADCQGTNELIANGENGLLVEGPDRIAALAKGLARLMGSEEDRVRMASAAPARLVPFARERIIGQWEDLLRAAATGIPALY